MLPIYLKKKLFYCNVPDNAQHFCDIEIVTYYFQFTFQSSIYRLCSGYMNVILVWDQVVTQYEKCDCTVLWMELFYGI